MVRLATLSGAGVLIAFLATAAVASGPIVIVYSDRLVPERLVIHRDQLVSWKTPRGQQLFLELDSHPSGHEVVVRAGEVQAYFREPGEHSYTVSDRTGRVPRGTVSIREQDPVRSPFCSPETTGSICFEP